MRPIPGFKDYFINIFGEVYSSKRGLLKKLKYVTTSTGYYRVALRKNEKTYYKTIHVLLRLTYMNNNSKKLEVNHIDGNKLNNSLNNLELVTHKENMQHAYDIGLIKRNYPKGILNSASKLTEQNIRDIRMIRRSTNLTLKELASNFDVSYATISDICRRKTWRHIK